MTSECKKFVKNRKLVTYRVIDWLEICSKKEIGEMIGISRPTLDVRIKKHSWNFKEIETIIKKMPL